MPARFACSRGSCFRRPTSGLARDGWARCSAPWSRSRTGALHDDCVAPRDGLRRRVCGPDRLFMSEGRIIEVGRLTVFFGAPRAGTRRFLADTGRLSDARHERPVFSRQLGGADGHPLTHRLPRRRPADEPPKGGATPSDAPLSGSRPATPERPPRKDHHVSRYPAHTTHGAEDAAQWRYSPLRRRGVEPARRGEGLGLRLRLPCWATALGGGCVLYQRHMGILRRAHGPDSSTAARRCRSTSAWTGGGILDALMMTPKPTA